MTDLFDDDDDALPSNVRRLHVQREREQRRPNNNDLDTMTLVLSVLREEREQRPDLVALLEVYPALLAEYLTIPSTQRDALDTFRRHHNSYFYARRSTGDYIRNLTERGCKHAAMIARKYRWAEELKEMFAFYLEHHKETHPFNNNYLKNNPELRQQFGTRGPTLVKNIYQNRIEVKDIVAVIASATKEPYICNYYQEPGYRSNAISLHKRKR
jgi:hypothetical protein